MERQQTPIVSFFVDCWVCRLRAGRLEYLLIQRATSYLTGMWQMVSGKLEQGETAHAAALRELREETGLVPDRFYSTDRVNSFYEPTAAAIMLVPVFAAFVEGDPPITLSREHDAYAWYDADAALELLYFEQHREVVGLLKRMFVDRTPPDVLRIEV